jgi:SAM-dependent methyltransferase
MTEVSHLWRVHVPCALCGADDTRVLRTLRHPEGQLLYSDVGTAAVHGAETLVRCRRCGLVYVNPQPRTVAPWRTYSASQEAGYFAATLAIREQGAARLLAILERRLGAPGSLLDIGCGDGALLRGAHERGWRVEGLESSAHLYCGLRAGVLAGRVIAGRAEEMSPDLGPYDAVTMLNVLEHVSDPGLVLANASRVLRPGGLLAVHVPNYAWGRLFGGHWHQLHPLDHLTYFTAGTLGRLLLAHDLVPEERFSLPPSRTTLSQVQRLLNALGIWLGGGLGVLAVRPAP